MRMLRLFFPGFGEFQAPPIGWNMNYSMLSRLQWIHKYSCNDAEEDGEKKIILVRVDMDLVSSTFLDRAPSRQSARFLDRGRQIVGLLWSADFPPRRQHLFPPRLLSKNEASMCRPLCEVGGGVDDLHCSATHSQGVLKPGNS